MSPLYPNTKKCLMLVLILWAAHSMNGKIRKCLQSWKWLYFIADFYRDKTEAQTSWKDFCSGELLIVVYSIRTALQLAHMPQISYFGLF